MRRGLGALGRLALSVAFASTVSCAPPYECGLNLSCTCSCEVCDPRTDGGTTECVNQRTVENPVLVCGPLEVDDPSLCEAAAQALVDAGAEPCLQKCALAMKAAGGLDVLSCALAEEAENPVLVSADDPACRYNPRIDLP